MLFTRLLATDVSFIYQHHPLLEPTIHYNGIELASPTDIGLMKLAAIMVLRALVYFEDAEQQPMPKLLKPIRWPDVKKYCETAVRQFTRRFSQLD